MKSDATKQTAHTMATVRNEARAPMADAAASGTPVRMAAAVCVFMMGDQQHSRRRHDREAQ